MEPTHFHRQFENATAPSAGGSPGPDGEVRLRMRLPFRTTSGFAILVRAGVICHGGGAPDTDHGLGTADGQPADAKDGLRRLGPSRY
ncbi:MAG: hypothetical protein ACOX52_03035 [Verrucomicrobiota bacterium]